MFKNIEPERKLALCISILGACEYKIVYRDGSKHLTLFMLANKILFANMLYNIREITKFLIYIIKSKRFVFLDLLHVKVYYGNIMFIILRQFYHEYYIINK